MGMYTVENRPKKLSEIIGHKSLIKELQFYSQDLNFPNYMLFHGPSGVGKTSTALIINKLIYCKNPVKNSEGYYDPCDECTSCKRFIANKGQMDSHHIQTSDIQEKDLQEIMFSMSAMSWNAKRKVFIFDDAHLNQNLKKWGKLLRITESFSDERSPILIFCTIKEDVFSIEQKSRLTGFHFKKFSYDETLEAIREKAILLDKDFAMRDSFYNQTLPALTEKANGNLRDALKEMARCVVAQIDVLG